MRQRKRRRRRQREPWEEFSFLFNSLFPWNRFTRRYGYAGWESISHFEVSGALSSTLENPLESFIALSVVHITASGLQGEQPLVNRTM
jgi:hypothetical protein